MEDLTFMSRLLLFCKNWEYSMEHSSGRRSIIDFFRLSIALVVPAVLGSSR